MKVNVPRTGIVCAGVGLVMGLLYLFSSDLTHTRRVASASPPVAALLPRMARRAQEAPRTLWSRVQTLWGRPAASNPELLARVRLAVDRVLASPHTLSVAADGNRVLLRGTVSPAEAGEVLDAVRRVRGVWVIESRLEIVGAA